MAAIFDGNVAAATLLTNFFSRVYAGDNRSNQMLLLFFLVQLKHFSFRVYCARIDGMYKRCVCVFRIFMYAYNAVAFKKTTENTEKLSKKHQINSTRFLFSLYSMFVLFFI